mgnify:CR=1 FL=1
MLLDGLDEDQRAVALATEGPVVVFAGAGAGKTRAITHRIAHAVTTGTHDPRRSLAVTFTTKAAGELRARLGALGANHVTASTFHAAALRQLRHFWPQVIGGEPWQIQASKARLVSEAVTRVGLHISQAELRDIAADIEWAKVRQSTPEQFATDVIAAGRTPALDARDVSSVWEAYEDLKQQRAVIDFEDVLLLTVGMLADRPDIASAVHERYRWFTVDEFQDVNPLQHRLLELWLGDRDDVCVVGDTAQTIYTFAGADPRFLERFPTRWPGATVITLARTYRCSPEIAGVANRVLVGTRQHLQLQSQNPSAAKPALAVYDDEAHEAAGIASTIAEWMASGVAARDIAVLYRTNAQSEAFEHAFAASGIAYSVRGSERFFDRAEIRRAITLLRGTAVATPEADVVATVRSVVIGLGWKPEAHTGGAATREAWEAYLALVTLAEELAAQRPDLTMASFVQELDARAEQQHAPTIDGVTLASLHAAKGLEWRNVVIAGCSEGMVPLAYAEGFAAVEEERRLFYVGVTRASEALLCTYARARTATAKGTRQPSRFLASLDAPLEATGGTGSVRRGTAKPARVRTGPARCRVCGAALVTGVERTLGRCATCPSSMDEGLYERLVAWRLVESRTRSVPAFVIFTDATLRAVAEQRPANAQELLRISGIGQRKLEEFGDALLDVLRD